MKKQIKKLVLAKETLRNFAAEDLDQVLGGSDYTRLPKPDTRWEPKEPTPQPGTYQICIPL
jgi:hypothetical protein